MALLTVVRALLPLDLTLLRRDPLFVALPFLPIGLALLARVGIPSLTVELTARLNLNLVPLYPLIASVFVLFMPSFAGMIAGFLLLDQRDEGSLKGLLVTPMSTRSYVTYRVALPVLASVAVSLLVVPLSGLATVPPLMLLGIVLLASLTAPLMALYLVAFAENKVAGFALAKSVGGIVMLPLASFFVAPPLQWLVGIVPTYWPLKAFWLAAAGSPDVWGVLATGTIFSLGLLALLLRRFTRVMHR